MKVRCRKRLPAESAEVRPAPGGYSSATVSDRSSKSNAAFRYRDRPLQMSPPAHDGALFAAIY
jgi:hypothetical protein